MLDGYAAENGAGAVLLIDAPDMNFTWKGAAGMTDPEAGLTMVPDDQFIISSITKMGTGSVVWDLNKIKK